MYKHKYLKYKQKYLDLKNNLKGGGQMAKDQLFTAIENRNIEQVANLINQYNEYNENDNTFINTIINYRDTPLSYAIKNNNFEMIEFLLMNGANSNLHDVLQRTPLFHAIQNNNIEVINLLLRYNADINLPNKFGRTALFFFMQFFRNNMTNAEDILNILLTNNANVNLRDVSNRTILISFITHVIRDTELMNENLTEEQQVNESRNLINKFQTYFNILDTLINAIPFENRASIISHIDNANNSVFTLLQNKGYVGSYFTEYLTQIIQLTQTTQPTQP
jgi:ankyrin repeat protein